MLAFLESLLAFFAVAGLCALLWLLFGRLLCPPPDGDAGFTLLPVAGDADGLEETLSRLLWLRGGGLLTFPIVLLDLGLSDLGRARLSRLMGQEPQLQLCTAEKLSTLCRKE